MPNAYHTSSEVIQARAEYIAKKQIELSKEFDNWLASEMGIANILLGIPPKPRDSIWLMYQDHGNGD